MLVDLLAFLCLFLRLAGINGLCTGRVNPVLVSHARDFSHHVCGHDLHIISTTSLRIARNVEKVAFNKK